MSYRSSVVLPSASTQADFATWSTRSISPITTSSARTCRSGTTTARGSIVPDATSGRNGWYCMKFSGLTTVTR